MVYRKFPQISTQIELCTENYHKSYKKKKMYRKLPQIPYEKQIMYRKFPQIPT
jgi:hypothetical protein